MFMSDVARWENSPRWNRITNHRKEHDVQGEKQGFAHVWTVCQCDIWTLK